MGLAYKQSGRGRRLVLAHGFTQNANCWGPFAHDLAADHQLVAVDLPGHGDTAPDHDEADLIEAGRLLAEVGGKAVYVGYSMGGRVALHTALNHPELVDGLVLIGATAGIDDADVRMTRQQADETLALQIERSDLAAFIDRWLANPLFSGLTDRTSARVERLANRSEGLAATLRCRGTGTQQPLWRDLAKLEIPVLVLVGNEDVKYTQIGQRLVEELPSATLRALPATHAVHLECATSSAETVRSFVEQHWPEEFLLS